MTKALLAVAALALAAGLACSPLSQGGHGRWKCELKRLGNKVQTEVCHREPY